MPSGIGNSIRYKYFKNKLLYMGENVLIKPHTSIHSPEKISLDDYCNIGEHCYLLGDGEISIGKYTMLAMNVTVISYDHAHKEEELICKQDIVCAPVYIGDNCWIGANTTILKGVSIGDNSIIGAGSVVTKDIPENSIAAGNPAKIIKKRKEEDFIY